MREDVEREVERRKRGRGSEPVKGSERKVAAVAAARKGERAVDTRRVSVR